jgi:hypothetical protein
MKKIRYFVDKTSTNFNPLKAQRTFRAGGAGGRQQTIRGVDYTQGRGNFTNPQYQNQQD